MSTHITYVKCPQNGTVSHGNTKSVSQ